MISTGSKFSPEILGGAALLLAALAALLLVNLGGADVNVSSILIDLTQRETMNVSAGFAKLLLREAEPNMTLRGTAHKFASFIVLKAPDTPSVLFETGFISNNEDAAFLTSAAGRQSIARSISSAVQAHFARRLALD